MTTPPLSRVSRSHDTVSQLTKLTSQKDFQYPQVLYRKNLDSICPAAAVSVQCGVQVELCYFIDIKIVLCEDKATVQNYCHILAQKVTIKRSFLFFAMLHSVRAGKHKISISRYDCNFSFSFHSLRKSLKPEKLSRKCSN